LNPDSLISFSPLFPFWFGLFVCRVFDLTAAEPAKTKLKVQSCVYDKKNKKSTGAR